MSAIELDTPAVQAARQPMVTASTLPPAWYTDQDIYDEIVEDVFRHSWIPLAHVSQLAKPSTYVALDLIGEPLVVTRDRGGDIHVLSNVCRHRWATIAEGSGEAKALQCPYHLWTYGLDGRLAGAPLMTEVEFDKSTCSLPEYRHEIWNGFIFMTFDETIEPLSPQLVELESIVKNWRLSELVVSSAVSETANWSWNVMVDNWAENYHVKSVHPESLEMMTPASLTAPIENHGEPWCYARLGHTSDYQETIEAAISTLDEEQRTYSAVGTIFPFFCFFTFPDMAAWLQVKPTKNVGELNLELMLFVEPEVMSDPDIDAIVAEQMDFARGIFVEDAEMCRRAFAGLHSADAASSRLSHLELSVWQAQNWLLDMIESRRHQD
ncbi:MAG: aromatic ring-hydroxylating dioxygenase subunit alpha [Acidimicrobiales bacterium]|nr:aromatic ring-hydroxylating dioxygenase subunit alpha [Acidimicrobiales bacterium]RZV47231.1 MAG: aromatic ring-hydroxylating dioxygenase subunit alpha [Acidimicrobiales bacterium]